MSKTYPKQLVCLGQVFVVNTKFDSLIMKGLRPHLIGKYYHLFAYKSCQTDHMFCLLVLSLGAFHHGLPKLVLGPRLF
jgi:hypothetical protein